MSKHVDPRNNYHNCYIVEVGNKYKWLCCGEASRPLDYRWQAQTDWEHTHLKKIDVPVEYFADNIPLSCKRRDK